MASYTEYKWRELALLARTQEKEEEEVVVDCSRMVCKKIAFSYRSKVIYRPEQQRKKCCFHTINTHSLTHSHTGTLFGQNCLHRKTGG